MIAALSPRPPKEMPLAQLLVKVVVADANADDAANARPFVLWLSGDAANAVAGAVPFRAFFTELEPVEFASEPRVDGALELRMKRLPLIHCRRQLPFGGAASDDGMFCHHSYTDVAAIILEDGRALVSQLRVTMCRQRSTLKGGDRFLVHGDDPSMPPQSIMLGSGPGPRPSRSVSSAPPDAIGDDGWDSDSGILPQSLPPRTASKGASAKPGAPPPGGAPQNQRRRC